jgi:DNA-binding response OmpR family regulator
MFIDLVIADRALRAAIAEQLGLFASAPLEARERENLSSSLAGDIPVAVILDAPLVNEKSCALLRTMSEKTDKPKIFLLGETSAGAEEDFITESFSKPLRLGHLLTRLNSYLQAARTQTAALTFGPFRLEPHMRQVVIEKTGAVIRLTEKETHLLEYLGRSENPVSREELLAAIWGYDARIDTHTLETHIYRLRRKLDLTEDGRSVIAVTHGAYHLTATS